MKLELNLDEVDFARALKLFAKAEDMAFMLWEYDQALRSKIKYDGKEKLQEARDMLYEHMRDFSIDLDDLR